MLFFFSLMHTLFGFVQTIRAGIDSSFISLKVHITPIS